MELVNTLSGVGSRGPKKRVSFCQRKQATGEA